MQSSEEAFEKLSKTADPDDIEEWTAASAIAQSERDNNPKAMDYFALKSKPGELDQY